MSETLKPCPFCGSTKLRVLNDYPDRYRVHCDGCSVEVKQWVTHERGRQLWNRRAPDPHGEDVEALKALRALMFDVFEAGHRDRNVVLGSGWASRHVAFNEKLLSVLRSRPVEPEPVAWLLQSRTKAEPHEDPDEWETEDFAYDVEWRDSWLADPRGDELRAVPLYASPVAPREPEK